MRLANWVEDAEVFVDFKPLKNGNTEIRLIQDGSILNSIFVQINILTATEACIKTDDKAKTVREFCRSHMLPCL